MILGEFAVNPDAIKEWKDLKFITMNFGFEHGAVISSFPKAWLKVLQQKAKSELKDVEYSVVTERLKVIKDEAIIKSGRAFKPEYDWIENSLLQQKNNPFYKIIHDSELADQAEVISFDSLDKHVFKGLREGVVKRDAASFAEVSRLLLENSSNIQFIDPYFSAAKGSTGKLDTGFFNSIKAMLSTAGVFKRTNIRDIQVHTSYKRSQTEVDIKEEKKILDEHYKKIIPLGKSIEFTWWDDEGTSEIHPRYLVTEKGGIRFDRGFVVPVSHEQREAETDVCMMTTEKNIDISLKYREETSPYNVIDRHIVQGQV